MPRTIRFHLNENCDPRIYESEGVKIGAINQPLRMPLTGKAIGFGTYETLALLGRQRFPTRIDRSLLTVP